MEVITVPDSEEVGIILTKSELLYLACAANIPTDWSVKEFLNSRFNFTYPRPEKTTDRDHEIRHLLEIAKNLNRLV